MVQAHTANFFRLFEESVPVWVVCQHAFQDGTSGLLRQVPKRHSVFRTSLRFRFLRDDRGVLGQLHFPFQVVVRFRFRGRLRADLLFYCFRGLLR